MPNISLYCYIFLAKKNSFDIEETLKNFSEFGDEICCATTTFDPEIKRNPELEGDETLRILKDLQPTFPKLKIIETSISLKDNRFDGLLKTAAMKACSNSIRCIADADERFDARQRPLWDEFVKELEKKETPYDGFFIPVIDLFGDKDSIRADQDIGVKMRLHRSTVTSRGVPFHAERIDGYFNTSISDSTEAKRGDQLADFIPIVPNHYRLPMMSRFLARFPLVYHLGYLSLERRVKINNEFWREKWQDRSGHSENLVSDIRQFEGIPTIKHGLPLWTS